MKKYIIFILILTLFTTISFSAPPDFFGGVNNEYKYEEIIFISGEPIKFTGTYSVSERERDNEKTVTYNFRKLTPEDKTIEADFSRTITYVTTYTNRTDKGQTIGQTEVTKFREDIEINGISYELEDYQFSKSDIIDNRPASDFYSGNMKGRKYYTINRDEGEVIVDITGGNAGYKNFWGNTETQLMDYNIFSEQTIADEDSGETDTVSWQGTVQIQTSDSQTKTLKYANNEADFSSFNGGHIRVTNSEMVSKYEYNLPRVDDEGEINDKKRNRGTTYLNQEMVPKPERLIVPKFRDVKGHWAEEYIEKLYSLDVFDEENQFFSPNLPASRLEFTKGIVRACDIRIETDEKTTRRRRNEPPEESPFDDVDVDDPDYEYIKSAVKKSIITGVTKNLFQPNDHLTRAQAITIIIRALGFESKAPNPGYYTSFDDDSTIPNWAKDSIYVARELNLIEGDKYNRVNPNKEMTKAEASAMLVRFLEFLEKDLQKDYRENIINFN